MTKRSLWRERGVTWAGAASVGDVGLFTAAGFSAGEAELLICAIIPRIP